MNEGVAPGGVGVPVRTHTHARLTGVPVCNITRSHYLQLACWPSRENARGLVYLRIPSNSHEMLPWYRSDVRLPGTFPSNALGSTTVSLSRCLIAFAGKDSCKNPWIEIARVANLSFVFPFLQFTLENWPVVFFSAIL